MSIHAIRSTQLTQIDRSLATTRRASSKSVSAKAVSEPNRDDSAPTLTPDQPSTADKGRAHGVLRLLAAGHFKSTPEARLMAKFGHLLPPAEEQPQPESPNVTPDAQATPTDRVAADASPVPIDTGFPLPDSGGVDAETLTRSINYIA